MADAQDAQDAQPRRLLDNPAKLSVMLFCAGALWGLFEVGVGSLAALVYSPKEQALAAFITTFCVLSAIWLALCLAAFRGFSSRRLLPNIAFWIYMLLNLPVFPIGSCIALGTLWARHKLRRQQVEQPTA